MTGGAGFSRWASNATKSNRKLLKGGSGSSYKSFDKSYITDYIISRKPLLFKEADPQYLEELQRRLKSKRKREVRKNVLVFIFSIVLILCLFILILI